MSVLGMLRRSGDMSLVLYGLRTLLALAVISPLVPGLPDSGASNPNDAALALHALASHAGLFAQRAPLPCAIYLLLVPGCTVAWCCSMRGAERALLWRHARTTYLTALALAAHVLLAGFLVLVLGGLALEYVPRALPTSAALEDALLAGVVLACGAALLVTASLYDLACAALSDRAVRLTARDALRLGRTRLSFSLLSRHAALAAAVGLALGFGELAARALITAAPPLVLPAQQLAIFGATLLRAAWLATAVQRMSERG